MRPPFVKHAMLITYIGVSFFVGCSGQNGLPLQNHLANQHDQSATTLRRANVASATSTPYRFQIVDVGHGANDVVYDSYLVANYTPGPTPSPTNTPYALGQPIYLIVRSFAGPPPTNVTWNNANGLPPAGYVSYTYPSPNVIVTAGAVTLTTVPPAKTGSTPIPYQEYALTNSGNVTVNGQIPGTTSGFQASVSIPEVEPTVTVNAVEYVFRVWTNNNGIQYLEAIGPTSPQPIDGNTEQYTVTSGSPSSGGRLSINQQITQYCAFLQAGSTTIFDRIEPTPQPLHTPYFDSSVPYEYAGVSMSPGPYYTPNYGEPTIAPGVGNGPELPVSMTQVDSPSIQLKGEVADARQAYPTASPIGEVGLAFTATVNLMYRPNDLPSSPPSIWVPLSAVQWSGIGAAIPATPAPGATAGDARAWTNSTPGPNYATIYNPFLPILSSLPVGNILSPAPVGVFQSQSCI